MKAVLDTNVIIDSLRAEDVQCTELIVRMKRGKHKMIVCRRLIDEYLNIFTHRNQSLQGTAQMFLMQHIPLDMMQLEQNPAVSIKFGPTEDRWHMELAIIHKADCHVSKDAGVLKCRKEMLTAGVRLMHPSEATQSLR